MHELTNEQIKETLIAAGYVTQWPSRDIHPAAYAGARAIIAADRALRQAGPPFDGLNIDSLHDALIWMGICTPDSREMLAVTAIEHMNLLTRAVMKQKADMAPLEAAIAIPEQRQAGQEPALWQYRWLNPGNNPNIGKNETAWLPVEPRNVHTDTVENRVRELRAYRYGGRPVYEVRPLYTAPPPAKHPFKLWAEYETKIEALEREAVFLRKLVAKMEKAAPPPAQVPLTDAETDPQDAEGVIALALAYLRWLKREDRGSTFSTFVNELPYDHMNASVVYPLVLKVIQGSGA